MLKLLQKEWQGLLGGLIKPKVRKYPPPPAVGFRIDEAVASTETSLAAAALTPNCKRKSSCRVWVRIAFSKGLAKKGGKFEVSADLKQARGTRRYAVPAKLMTITGTAMSVDVPLGQLPLTRGKYVGRVKVLCGGRYASKALTLDLARSW